MSSQKPIHFFTDSHVDKQVAIQLRKRSVAVTRAQDIDMEDEGDEILLIYATDHQMIMVSCDEDFVRIHDEWLKAEKEHSGIVYFRTPDQCNEIGLMVRELFFLYVAADYEQDLYNQLWRVKS